MIQDSTILHRLIASWLVDVNQQVLDIEVVGLYAAPESGRVLQNASLEGNGEVK